MKIQEKFYLFLLIILGIYFLIYYKNNESFISDVKQDELFNRYQDDFKISPLDKFAFNEDLQLFIDTTEILEKKK
tara:strand:- start:103 stop:327 length:225 start_codon:yes stop_codon:yes gene_type:complete